MNLDPDRLLIETERKRRRSRFVLEFAEADSLRTAVATCVGVLAFAIIIAVILFHK